MIQKGENPFADAFEAKRPLILDGAMGSLLQQKGYKPDSKIWMTSLNKSFPDLIRSVHRSYIDSGANIITTNTFRTNPAALKELGIFNPAPLVMEAVKLARESINELPIYIAGSNAPAEDCYQKARKLSYKELQINHINHIDLLVDNDIHFILNETQSHFDEIKIICDHCSKNEIPYLISLLLDENLNILSGESVDYVLKFTLEHEPLAIGFNCISPGTFNILMDNLRINYYWGFYLNCGGEDYFKEEIVSTTSPVKYRGIVEKNLDFKPSFVGACCGSNPEHIKEIKALLNGKID